MVTIAYLAIILIAVSLIAVFLFDKAHLVSRACIVFNRCSSGENLILMIIGLGWIGISLWCMVQGGRGRLFGCRIRKARARAIPSASPAV